MSFIVIKIDVKKVNKDLLYKGAKGLYLNAALTESPSEYEDDGFIRQDVGREARAAGEKGPIIGNYRVMGSDAPKPTKPKVAPESLDSDEIPW